MACRVCGGRRVAGQTSHDHARVQTDLSGMAGTIDVGGDLGVNRFGLGAMRVTGDGIWGRPVDHTRRKWCCAAGDRPRPRSRVADLLGGSGELA